MTYTIQLFDVVALIADLPDKGLLRGQVGTVIENLAPGVFEVEFSDDGDNSVRQFFSDILPCPWIR